MLLFVKPIMCEVVKVLVKPISDIRIGADTLGYSFLCQKYRLARIVLEEKVFRQAEILAFVRI